MHDDWPCIGQENSVTKADQLHGSRVLFAGEQDALWTKVAMNYVVTVTVSDCFGNLPHVVTTVQCRQTLQCEH